MMTIARRENLCVGQTFNGDKWKSRGVNTLPLHHHHQHHHYRHHQRHQHHSHDHDHSDLRECIWSWQGGLEGSGPCVLQTNDSPHHDHDDNYGENGDEIFYQNLFLENKNIVDSFSSKLRFEAHAVHVHIPANE